MNRTAKLDKILRPLALTDIQAYLSNTVQVADVIEWIVSQIGKAEIWVTTFSVSEEFLRRLYFISKRNKGLKIHLILDRKATQKTLSLWPFLSRTVNSVSLADNHSKIILFSPQNRRVKMSA